MRHEDGLLRTESLLIHNTLMQAPKIEIAWEPRRRFAPRDPRVSGKLGHFTAVSGRFHE
jgi:hypothetical protein